MKAAPTIPLAVPELVITGGGDCVTFRTSVRELVPPVLVALMVIFVLPVCVGVPLITPVVVLIVRPLGSGVALKLVGLFVATI